MEGARQQQQQYKLLWKVLFLLFGFIQLIVNLDSSSLFLWPLNHSCARSNDLNRSAYYFTDSRHQQIDLDIIQTDLFDATPEDPITAARAIIMGINYDDIAHCFEHPSEYTGNNSNKTSPPIVNMNSLEPCRHGLRYEAAGHNLSVISHFQLACTRQWLKSLLPQSLGLGLLVGVLISCLLHWHFTQLVRAKIALAARASLLLPVDSRPVVVKLDQVDNAFAYDLLGSSSFVWISSMALSVLLAQWSIHILAPISSVQQAIAQNKTNSAETKSFMNHSSDIDSGYYAFLLLSSFTRALIIGSSVGRIILFWMRNYQISDQEAPSPRARWERYEELKRNHIYFVVFILIYIIAKAIYLPFALRRFESWRQLNEWLTSTSCFYVLALALYEQLLIRPKFAGNFRQTTSWLTGALGRLKVTRGKGPIDDPCEVGVGDGKRESSDQGLLELEQDGDARGRSGAGDTVEGQTIDTLSVACTSEPGQAAAFNYEPGGEPIKVCEFCLVNEHAFSVGMNHRMSLRKQHQQQQQMQQNNNNSNNHDNGNKSPDSTLRPTEPMVAFNFTDLYDAYQPTTMPIGCSAAINPGGLMAASNQRLARAVDLLGLSHLGAGVGHNFAPLYKSLLECWPLLWLLTFCVSLNYFLFQMLPDHKLLHGEPIASQMERKLFHAKQLDAVALSEATGTTSKLPLLEQAQQQQQHHQLSELDSDRPSTMVTHKSNDTNELISLTFDYRSLNYATESVEALRNSYNPFTVIWTTIGLTSWPLDALVVLLHIGRLSSFEPTYFKLNRLLVLVKFGAQLLFLEWLLMAIIRRRNHLLEVSWLHTVALLLAKLSAALMAYNYMHTMLKMSRLMVTNSLVKFAPTVICALVAFNLASLAPTLEQLDLVIIPITLVVNNSLAYLAAVNLSERFKSCLCPMMLE